MDHRGRALRKQMALANSIAARFLLVLGDDEVAAKKGSLKDMDSGEETPIELACEALCQALAGGCGPNCTCNN